MALSLELEHAIGFSGHRARTMHAHPNARDLVYAAGGCVIISDLGDPHNQIFLRGHDDTLSCLELSPSGSLIASGQMGTNADVVVWSFDERRLLFRAESHDHGVICCPFSHDEKLLLTIGDSHDRRLFVWNVSNGMMNAQAQLPAEETTAAAWGGFERDVKRRPTHRYVFATAGAKFIVLWTLDPSSGILENVRFTTGSHNRDYTCLQFSEDGEWLFAGSRSGDVTVLSVRSRTLQTSFQTCQGGVCSLAYIPPAAAGQNGLLLSGGGDGNVRMQQGFGKSWADVPRGTASFTGKVTSISPIQGTGAVTVATDQAFVYRLALADMQVERISENHSQSVNACNFPADATDIFASVSDDCSVRVWSLSDYRVVMKNAVRGVGRPTCCDFGLEAVLTGWADGRIRTFDAETGELLWVINDAHRGGVTALKVSHNLRFVVSGGAEGDVRLWDMKSREMVCHLKEHTLAVTRIVLTADDTHAISCAKDRCTLTWDLRFEKRVASHVQRMGALFGLALHPDGTHFVTVGQEKRITVWNLADPQPIRTKNFPHGEAEPACIATSHCGRYIVTGGVDQMVRLWDFETLEQLAQGSGHSGNIVDIVFAPDDRQVVSVGTDGCILVWNFFQD